MKDVLAHLRVVANPRDAVSWHRILLLLEGVGPKTRRRRSSSALAGGAGAVGAARPPVRRSRGTRAADAARLGDAARASSAARHAPGGAGRPQVLDYYAPGAASACTATTTPSASATSSTSRPSPSATASSAPLLADMALEPPTDSVGDVLAADVDDEGMLTLSTIHSAKGLEWHTVFVHRGSPTAASRRSTRVDDDDLEEERRLMYVAVHARAGEPDPELPDGDPRALGRAGGGAGVALPGRPSAHGLLEHVTLVDEV